MANQQARQDDSKFPALLGHSSLTDPSETRRVLATDGELHTSIPSSTKTNPNTSSNELLVNLEGHQCPQNTTVVQLTADASFTGSGWQDTLDYGVLSVNISTDQNSATDGLDIQWSNDGVNASDHDYFTILANVSKTFTFGPAQRYFRVKYTNGSGGTTTTFHLTSLLRRVYVKPSSHRISDSIVGEDDAELIKSVLTGLAPDGSFKNVPVTNIGTLRTAIEDSETSKRAEVDALGQLKTVQSVTLVGTAFENGTKDTNFWTEAVTGSGAVTQAGEIYLNTGTTADSTASYTSVRKGRKVPGAVNQLRTVARFVTPLQANNIRRLGAYTDQEGFFFQVNGLTFGVGSRKGGVDTIVENGSFNGNTGATITMDTQVKRLVIDMSEFSVKFFVNDVLLHTMMNATTSLTNTLTLPVKMENINSGGNTTDNEFEVRFASIQRLGNIITSGTYKYLGTNDTTVCKYGAGTLQRIINVDNAGNVNVYDNTAGSGTLIATIDTAKALGTLDFNVPFSNGLTIVVALGAKIVVVYE